MTQLKINRKEYFSISGS